MLRTKDKNLKVLYRRDENGGVDVWIHRGNTHIATIEVDKNNHAKLLEGRKE